MNPSETWKQITTQKVTVSLERCIGCGACAGICPFMVYEMRKGAKGKKVAVAVYPQDCFLCQSCQARCPTDAIAIEW